MPAIWAVLVSVLRHADLLFDAVVLVDDAIESRVVLRCRACGYEGLDRSCPHCIADTMRPRKSRG